MHVYLSFVTCFFACFQVQDVDSFGESGPVRACCDLVEAAAVQTAGRASSSSSSAWGPGEVLKIIPETQLARAAGMWKFEIKHHDSGAG